MLGTWQNPALRERIEPVTFAMTFNLHQFDNEALAMYFGVGDISEENVFGVALQPVPIERALFVRIVDGDDELDLYVPKVSIKSEDDIEADVEALLELPVRATWLGITGQNLADFMFPGLGDTA
ncbi:hypothetical protein [Actinomycetospora sp. CA-053990]|uniref:phage tail tube protein n=1 Tax=Actinomycetospora sp. CA-053990 TaxID=3239891 RepID=UPI003D8C9C75